MMTPTTSPHRQAATRLAETALAAALCALLTACASQGPGAASATAKLSVPTAAATWQAPAPAASRTAPPAYSTHVTPTTGLDDPALPTLVQATLDVSADLASAANRIAQARASRVAASAAMGPLATATAGASRSDDGPRSAPVSALSAGAQLSWEIDLFGGLGAARDAAQARVQASEAAWHGQRLALAAEAASSLTAWRACQAQLALTQQDADSRAETARLTQLSAQAGFQAPAAAALAQATAAQGRNLVRQQQAQCDSLVKALVALSGTAEPALRELLAGPIGSTAADRLARLAASLPAPLPAVPAALLNQRPDLAEQARQVDAAAADIVQTDASASPRLTLNGSVGALRLGSGATTASGSTWSLGPLQLSLPILDGGRLRAEQAASRAAYDAAVSTYQASLRTAVREVEDALLTLASTAARAADAQAAADNFDAALRATQARQRGGLASLFELEDARRSALQARSALVELQRERATATINLHRALGGGWTAEATSTATTPQ